MSQEPLRTTIKGVDYALIRMPPVKAGRVALRVGALLSHGLADIEVARSIFGGSFEGMDASKVEASIRTHLLGNVAQLVSALAGGVSKIDVDALYAAGMECITGNLIADRPLKDEASINAHFSEHQQNMLPVLAWAIKENCAGFFGFGAKA